MTKNFMPTDLKNYITDFKNWLKTNTGDATTWQKEREDRLDWYRKHLSEGKLAKLSRDDFATLIKALWATNIWKNKDYKVEQLLKDNGLEKIRASLDTLLYGRDPVAGRWDEFKSSIKGLGPSSISEILTFSDPYAFALVNKKPYKVLPRLGLPLKTVGDGKSYATAVEQIGKVMEALRKHGLEKVDFILTDFFIAYLFYEVFNLQYAREVESVPRGAEIDAAPVSTEVRVSASLPIENHEAAQAILLSLGKFLKFDTYTADPSKEYNGQKLGDLATLRELPYFATEKAMDSARRIDVVWVNGEWPEYFFEVEQSTGVTSGLHRMYQVIRVDAKFFIVAPGDEERRRFEREVEKNPYKDVKHKYRFRSYDELRDMFSVTSDYSKISDHFLG